MSKRRQAGFSLMELLVAMMIMAVIGTLGFVQVKKHTAKARHLAADDDLKVVAQGLDTYYLRHGVYPDFSSYQAMVDPASVLVKESLIPVNKSPKDPWGQDYEARSSKGTYFFKCLGDPSNPEDPELGSFTREPGKVTGATGGIDNGSANAPGGAAGGAAPAGAGK
jgi:general secretion pathway protein G